MKCSMRRIRSTGARIPQRPYRAGRGIAASRVGGRSKEEQQFNE
jgi:hypothetical protein